MEQKQRIIGITGGVCSGKSTCAGHLKSLGYLVIDCDKLGHETYEQGTECFKKLVSHFGEEIIDKENNSINRRVLGRIVFSSKDQMEKLREIVWPEIEKLIVLNIKKNPKKKIIIFEAAILFEAGWDKHMSEVWVCSTSRESAIARLMERNKKSKEEAEKIMKNQLSNEEREKKAKIVINTDKLGKEEMKKYVEELLK